MVEFMQDEGKVRRKSLWDFLTTTEYLVEVIERTPVWKPFRCSSEVDRMMSNGGRMSKYHLCILSSQGQWT